MGGDGISQLLMGFLYSVLSASLNKTFPSFLQIMQVFISSWKEGNILFNNLVNAFYLVI